MTDMLSKLAEIIADESEQNFNDRYTGFDSLPPHRKGGYVRAARAILVRISSPTEGMLEAGAGEVQGLDCGLESEEDVAASVWSAMLNHVLNGGEG